MQEESPKPAVKARGRRSRRFVMADRDTDWLLPPSVQEWLPRDHLVRFVVEVMDQLDPDEVLQGYAGPGSAVPHPRVLVGLLVYGYASGV
jgi:hypothetical protein